ncbi:MAG: DUF2782 domain-containing protein [Nitrosomonas sp.]|nr:DUF2782 domain-containing protein [Nitrosomonas sp.]MDP1951507.1 DUF2782 domain-containing protein [Nitrosomonas sp.]
MHRIIFLLLLSFTVTVTAQPDLPKDLQPLPELAEPPPLPPDLELDPELEPQITIIQRGEDTIEEHRISGEIYMIKVIPRIGLPYYLVKNRGRGLHTHPGEPGSDVSPPMWKLLEF